MDETLTGLERKALRYLEEHREELNRLLAELIAVDTQNFGSNGREAALAPLVEGLYQSLGMETEVYCPDETEGFLSSPLRLPGRNTDRRPNVTGVLRGQEGAGAVMLAAHSDTMPAGDLSAWEASPFEAVIRDGRITGLGACDDKFGIAGSWWAVKVLRDLGIPLKKTVVLTAYCDEEFGGGNGALAACLKYPCETYVNLDGGSYEMWATALGGGVFQLKLHLNRVSDDCMPIYRALAAFMTELETFGQRRREELERNPFYRGTPIAGSAFRVAEFGSVGESHTDAQVTFVIYTDRSQEEIRRELDAITERLTPLLEREEITTEGFQHTSRFFQYAEADQSHPAFQTMHRCAALAAGRPVEIKGSCLTDLSVFFAAGGTNASFNFGILRDFSLPGGAHQPNEYADCQEFLNFTKALVLFLMRYGGAEEERV